MPLTKITLLAIAAALTAVANDLEAESETNGEPAAPVTPKPRGRTRGSTAAPPVEPAKAPVEESHGTIVLATSDEQPKAPSVTVTVTVEDLKAAAAGLIKGGKGVLVKEMIKNAGGESFSTTPDSNKPALLAAIQHLAKEVPADEFS